MKTLYIVRHAKSSWDEINISDFDRPLNERGKRDAPRMGRRLKEKNILPNLMLSSPAKRALSTCRRIAEVLGYDTEKIKTDRSLYHASEDSLLDIIRNVKDKHTVLMIFGHNPGLTDFVNELSTDDNFIDNIPTCGVVCFKFPIETWKQIDFGKGEFIFFDFPKANQTKS
jgi:phosphohistidine phosphatase